MLILTLTVKYYLSYQPLLKHATKIAVGKYAFAVVDDYLVYSSTLTRARYT